MFIYTYTAYTHVYMYISCTYKCTYIHDIVSATNRLTDTVHVSTALTQTHTGHAITVIPITTADNYADDGINRHAMTLSLMAVARDGYKRVL